MGILGLVSIGNDLTSLSSPFLGRGRAIFSC
jgi:hypothetical protein